MIEGGELRVGVYPRMYGETMRGTISAPGIPGLSPHVRGNPLNDARSSTVSRSIPACTGKPGADNEIAEDETVYPRMYGETDALASWQEALAGLSPHVRGNPIIV